ncbi:DUF3046 domain-containing protein [Corynebacterium propinquum]|uniref:DUF3046 domain-containing protein n=1 Tax=Corynebacterium propinquum TaxID=43769 RepID=UPI00254321AC|nr:DUF3046 domain-containing protein [Corynebacterium propinquum]MDK4302335.1 DUF3046 domain-containing protein [Corynebacterium propinquum]
MRLTEFSRLLRDEFGETQAKWIAHSHVLTGREATADELIEAGVDPAEIWDGIMDDFRIPEERRLGKDNPGW